MRLKAPIDPNGQEYRPDFLPGQTVLFPLDRQLKAKMNKIRSLSEGSYTHLIDIGYLDLWRSQKSNMHEIKESVKKVISSIESSLASYISNLEVWHPAGREPGPKLPIRVAKHDDVTYSLYLRISDELEFVIASPSLEHKFSDDRITVDNLEAYGKATAYVFLGEQLKEVDRHTYFSTSGCKLYVKPVEISHIPTVAQEFSALMTGVMGQERFHKATKELATGLELTKMDEAAEKKYGLTSEVKESKAATKLHYNHARAALRIVARNCVDTPTLDQYLVSQK